MLYRNMNNICIYVYNMVINKANVCVCVCVCGRAEVRSSLITTTVREESQVTPQGSHW